MDDKLPLIAQPSGWVKALREIAAREGSYSLYSAEFTSLADYLERLEKAAAPARKDIGEVLDQALPGGLTGVQGWLEGRCPVCQATDLKDLGWVQDVHVLICKGCGNYLARVVAISLITDPKILTAIDVEKGPPSSI